MKYAQFLQGARQAVYETWDLKDAAKFITQKTWHRGTRFSFVNHEFQETIITDDSQIVNVQKCSQIGLSEIMARFGVAVVNMIPDFSVIVTFPFSGDASNFAKTRIDPFVEASPALREAINPKMNNGEIKQFGTSFMYFRGTNGKTQAISIPADMIISDEIDRSDPHILSQYTSRLTHSDWKMRRNFSTPTIPGFGIAKEMSESIVFKNLCKCDHCAQWFLPDYFDHVKIPEFDGNLRTISKSNIGRLRYQEAQLHCPHCGAVPNLQPKNREWVAENKDANFSAHGYMVSPFDAPNLISVVDLIKASTMYARFTEFVNQNLGLPEEDAAESITLSDLNAAQLPPGTDMRSSSLHCMGIDQGLICHIVIGRLTLEGEFLVCYRERCPLGQLQERKRKLAAEWKVVITVIDSQPNVHLVQEIQKYDKNCYGGVYGKNKKQLEPFRIQMFEGEAMDGKLPIHTAQINRDKAFDLLMHVIKSGTMKWAAISQDDDELFEKHILDMRRVQVYDEHMELAWVWVKSTLGQDHYHHTLLYCWIACQLRATASRAVGFTLPGGGFMSKFKVKHDKDLR
jgi:hypothetical protein